MPYERLAERLLAATAQTAPAFGQVLSLQPSTNGPPKGGIPSFVHTNFPSFFSIDLRLSRTSPHFRPGVRVV
jgi:hypothetical protein